MGPAFINMETAVIVICLDDFSMSSQYRGPILRAEAACHVIGQGQKQRSDHFCHR